MINHVFISFSAVQIYDLSYIHLQTYIDQQGCIENVNNYLSRTPEVCEIFDVSDV